MRGSHRRPTSVTVVAVLWIVLGALIVWGGGAGIAASVSQARAATYPSTDTMSRPMAFLERHIRVVGGAQLCLGIVAIVCAIFLLRLRAWARRALEVISAVWIILLVGFMSVFTTSVFHIRPGYVGPGMMFAVMTCGAGVILWAAPGVITLVFLRGNTARTAVSRPSGPGAVQADTRPQIRRPASVRVLGWLCIIFSALAAYTGIAWLAAPVFWVGAQDSGASGDVVWFLSRHIRVLGATKVCLGIFGIVSAIYLLKLRVRACRAVQAASLLWLILLAGLGTLYVVWSLSGGGGADWPGRIISAVVTVFGLLMWAAPAVIALILAGSKTVRAALCPSPAALKSRRGG